MIIELRYTALFDGGLESTVKAALPSFSGVRFVSLSQEFSTEWHAFTSGQKSTLDFEISENMFALNLKPNSLKIGDKNSKISVTVLTNAPNDKPLTWTLNGKNVAITRSLRPIFPRHRQSE